MNITEKQIIERVRNGELAAFEELVVKYERRVYCYAFRFMGNNEDAHDLAQEVFLRAYRALPHFRGEAALLTWLLRITANACLDELRRRQRTETWLLSNTDEKEDGQSIFPAAAALPEQVLETMELRRCLAQALQILTEAHRTVIILHDLQGYTYKEIAELLHCSIGTVKSRLCRGRTKLRSKICSCFPELIYRNVS